MICVVEISVPTVDIHDRDDLISLSKELNSNEKAVASRDVSTQVIPRVAESRILFGVDAKRLEDAITMGLSAFRTAWRRVKKADPRILKITVQDITVKWSEDGKENQGSN